VSGFVGQVVTTAREHNGRLRALEQQAGRDRKKKQAETPADLLGAGTSLLRFLTQQMNLVWVQVETPNGDGSWQARPIAYQSDGEVGYDDEDDDALRVWPMYGASLFQYAHGHVFFLGGPNLEDVENLHWGYVMGEACGFMAQTIGQGNADRQYRWEQVGLPPGVTALSTQPAARGGPLPLAVSMHSPFYDPPIIDRIRPASGTRVWMRWDEVLQRPVFNGFEDAAREPC